MDFKNRFTYSLNNKAQIGLVLVAVLVINLIFGQFFLRYDATRSKVYSISDSTIEILQDLDDLVSLKLYISPDLPPQLLPSEQFVKDLLAEYQAFSKGNVELEYADMSRSVVQQEALQVGVQRVEMQVLENDRYQVRHGYFGMTVSFEGNVEAIPVFQDQGLATLEYDLTSIILKLSQESLPVVSFLHGHGEHELVAPGLTFSPGEKKDYSVIAQLLRKNVDVQTINFAEGDTLEETDVLVVAGASRDLTDRAVYEIDQYLLNGGRALFLIDALEVVPGSVTVIPVNTNLTTLLEPIGITVQSQLVFDRLMEMATFQVDQVRSFFVPYPVFIKLVQKHFSDHPIVQKVATFTVRFSSVVTILEQEGLEYQSIASTSPASWIQEGPQFQTDPNGIPPVAQDQLQSYPVVVSVSGLFPRLSDATDVPPLQQWVEDEEGEMTLEFVAGVNEATDRETITEARSPAEVIVVADSDFVADHFVDQQSPALVVFQNMVDYLSFGDSLITIRSKSLGDAPLDDLERSAKSLLRFVGILLMPIIITLYGCFRLWVRRKEEKLLRL